MKKGHLHLPLLFCCLWVVQLVSTAQQVSLFGELTPEEFTPQYPEAEAEIIFDQQVSYFMFPDNDLKLVTERHTRVLIHKEEGYDWGEAFLPYYVENFSQETIYKIQAATYHLTETGKIATFSLDKKDIFEEKKDKNRRAKRFTLPQLKEGCIVEYRYRMESDYLSNMEDWVFQRSVPVRWSECEVRMPPMFEFFVNQENIDRFDLEKEFQAPMSRNYLGLKFHDQVYQWGLKDIPAWKREKMITTLSDYFPQIDFQISEFRSPSGNGRTFAQNWETFGKEMLSPAYYGRYLNGGKAVKELSKSLAPKLKGKNPEGQLQQIHQFVRKQFSWDGKRRLWPENDNLKQLVKVKKGNSADINVLLYHLLRQQGFTVKPVILSTTNHGKVNTKFPFKRDYNYFLPMVQLEEQSILLDATDPLLPYPLLPQYCFTDRGLILEKKACKWIPIPYEPVSKNIKTRSYIINEDNSIEGRETWTFNHHQAAGVRKRIARSGEADFKKELEQQFLNGELNVQEVAVEHQKELDQDLKVKVTFTKDNEDLDKLYLAPFPHIRKDLIEVFTEQDRQFPIHWDHLQDQIYTTRIIIKGDYELVSYPKSTSVVFPDGSVRFSLSSAFDQNILTIRYKLSIKSLDFHKTAYPVFKKIFSLIEEKQNDYILLERKTAPKE